MSHRYRIMKKPQAPPVRRRRRPRQGSSSETRPCRVLTGRVRNPGGGGGGRAREAGRGGRRFSRSCGGCCRPGARVRDAGCGGGVFCVLAGGFPGGVSPGGGGKGLNRGFGGCTGRMPSPFRRRSQRSAARAHRAERSNSGLRRGAARLPVRARSGTPSEPASAASPDASSTVQAASLGPAAQFSTPRIFCETTQLNYQTCRPPRREGHPSDVL